MLTQQHIQHLITKFTLYKQRQKPILTLQSLSNINPEDFVTCINGMIQKEALLLDQIINQTIGIVKAFSEIYSQNLSKFEEINIEIDHKQNEIEDMRQKNHEIQKQNMSLLGINKLLQEQIQSLKMSIEDMHQNFMKENLSIKNKLEQQKNLSSKSIEIYQKIHGRNSHTNIQNSMTYQQKAELQQKVNDLIYKMKDKEEQLQKSQRKLDWQQKMKYQFQQTIREKQQIIQQLNFELQQLRDTLKQHYGQIQANLQMFQPPNETQNQSQPAEKYMLKLGEQVYQKTIFEKEQQDAIIEHHKIQRNVRISNIKAPQTERTGPNFTMNRTNSEVIEVVPTERTRTVSKITNKTLSKFKKALNLDPYYCHYILLSMTVKLSQNSQNFFNIDMKSYYKEILGQKIPIHYWKQWIIDKMKQLSEQKENKSVIISHNQEQEKPKGIELIQING